MRWRLISSASRKKRLRLTVALPPQQELPQTRQIGGQRRMLVAIDLAIQCDDGVVEFSSAVRTHLVRLIR
jgi:hypothetical protein